MVSVEDLKAKGYLQAVVAPWGECVVVPGAEFDPDWEAQLDDQGVRCYFGDLDGHAVVFVQLKRSTAPSKVAYVSPSKPESASVEKPLDGRSKGIAVRGPAWSPEDEAELLREYDRLAAAGQDWGAYKVLAELPRFKDRTVASIEVKLKRLRKMRRDDALPAAVKEFLVDGNLEVKQVSEEKNGKRVSGWLNKWRPEEDKILLDAIGDTKFGANRLIEPVLGKLPGRTLQACLWRVGVLRNKKERKQFAMNSAPLSTVSAESKKNAEMPELQKTADPMKDIVLPQACYDILNKRITELEAKVEQLHAKLDGFEDNSFATNTYVDDCCAEVRRDLAKHKHAQGSGEAVLPMEV